MERDHGPQAEGAASFHTTRWTIVMRTAQNQTLAAAVLAELCRLYCIRSTCSLDAAGIRQMTPIGCGSGAPRYSATRSAAQCQIRQRSTRRFMLFATPWLHPKGG